MEFSEEDPDLLNEETFDCAEIGDWEGEHELFVQNLNEDPQRSPTADELPKFWKDSDDLSFLWQSDSLSCGTAPGDDGGEGAVDVEETLKKLVLDEAFEDPAILDISRKVSYQKFNEKSFQNLRNAPAYPTASTNIFDGSRDIWSIDSCNDTGLTPESSSLSDPSSKSIASIIQSLAACAPSNSSEAFAQNNLMHMSNTESQVLGPAATEGTKLSHSQSNFLTANFPGSQHSSKSPTITGSQTYQPQVNQNRPAYRTEMATNSASPEVLKGQSPHDPSVLLTLLTLRSLFAIMPTSQLSHSQIQSLYNIVLTSHQRFLQNPRPTFMVPSNQRNPLFISPEVSGPLGSNMQSNISSYLRFPVHSVNVDSKQPVCQPSPIASSKQPTVPVGVIGETTSVKDVDPNRGSWMTDYESIGVLLIQLRPLMVSNPYVQDYYFACRWLRNMNAIRAKQIANGQLAATSPPASMQIPIPIPLESLNDSQSPYQIALKNKLVIPFSSVNINQSPDQTVEENNNSTEKSHENNEPPNPDSSNALGRPTRSNVHRPRVVAELSLVSALTNGPEQATEKSSNDKLLNDSGSDLNQSTASSSSVVSSRRRRLLLAQIERMFSLLLILDEVALSLERVVVQNDTRARLLDYRRELVDQLVSELFKSPGKTSKEICETLPKNKLLHLTESLFTIHKGMRLWSLTLQYLPNNVKEDFLAEFINDFIRLVELWPTTLDEAAAIFYPSLREVIYQMRNINDFLQLCFPDALTSINAVADNSELTIPISDNLKSLLACKLGLSLIFCLLDACARASNPTDPSHFIQFGAYFSYVNSFVDLSNQTDGDDRPRVMESFPHLASILMLYIKPSRYHYVVTDEHLNVFCELAKGTTKLLTNSNGSNNVLSTNSIMSSRPSDFHPYTMNNNNNNNSANLNSYNQQHKIIENDRSKTSDLQNSGKILL
ncbi:unnamed protein product [Trichobilharzia szidati]|nr:unnamed protein product [Trichobilharzia szidati]